MTTVAVVAHQKKSLGGGLDELRSVLAHEGFEPLWYEVPKSKKAPDVRPRGASRRAPTSCSCGAATAWCSAASTPLAGTRRDDRHPPGRHRQPPRHQPRHPQGPRRPRSTIGLHGVRRKLDVGRDQRRAVRGHGRRRVRRADDPATPTAA